MTTCVKEKRFNSLSTCSYDTWLFVFVKRLSFSICFIVIFQVLTEGFPAVSLLKLILSFLIQNKYLHIFRPFGDTYAAGAIQQV